MCQLFYIVYVRPDLIYSVWMYNVTSGIIKSVRAYRFIQRLNKRNESIS